VKSKALPGSENYVRLSVQYPGDTSKKKYITLNSIAASEALQVSKVTFSKEWPTRNLYAYLEKLPSECLDLWEIRSELSSDAEKFLQFYGERSVVACCKLEESGSILWGIPGSSHAAQTQPNVLSTLAAKKKLKCGMKGNGYIMVTRQAKKRTT